MTDSRVLLNNALCAQPGPYIVLVRSEALRLEAELSLLDKARRFLNDATQLLVTAPQNDDLAADASTALPSPLAHSVALVAQSAAKMAQLANGHAPTPNPTLPPLTPRPFPSSPALPAEEDADPVDAPPTPQQIAEAFGLLMTSRKLFSDFAKPLQRELLIRVGAEMCQELGQPPGTEEWDLHRPSWAPTAKRITQSWKSPWIDWRAAFDAFAAS